MRIYQVTAKWDQRVIHRDEFGQTRPDTYHDGFVNCFNIVCEREDMARLRVMALLANERNVSIEKIESFPVFCVIVEH